VGETRELVGALAEKTPLGGAVNVHHHTLQLAELAGKKIEMSRRPIMEGGRQVASPSGRGAVVFDPSTAMMALSRWQEGDFLEVERQFAKAWRAELSNIDLDGIFRQGRDIISKIGRPRDLAASKSTAMELLSKHSSRYAFDALLELQPQHAAKWIVERWKSHGCPPITHFAPYTAHLLTVDLFFCLALAADLIGRQRPTNKIDIAYLYYLPFCMMFTSRDKLHARTAPLFLTEDQVFVPGDELKADLARLDEHYSQLPDKVKERGVMSFAHFPPAEGDFLVSRLWDQLMMPGWREHAMKKPERRSKEEEVRIVAEINALTGAPRVEGPRSFSLDGAESVVIRRSIPVQRGKWRMVPPEAENGRR
jgi:hypothetical protein